MLQFLSPICLEEKTPGTLPISRGINCPLPQLWQAFQDAPTIGRILQDVLSGVTLAADEKARGEKCFQFWNASRNCRKPVAFCRDKPNYN